MRRHRQEIGPLTEINVTNLLDTAFVLLMAFMVVAPATQNGLTVDLPEVANGPVMETDTKKTLTITIAKKSFDQGSEGIYLGERRYSLAQLKTELEQTKARHKDMDVIMEVDKGTPFQTFAETLGVIKETGINDIGIVTVPAPAQK